MFLPTCPSVKHTHTHTNQMVLIVEDQLYRSRDFTRRSRACIIHIPYMYSSAIICVILLGWCCSRQRRGQNKHDDSFIVVVFSEWRASSILASFKGPSVSPGALSLPAVVAALAVLRAVRTESYKFDSADKGEDRIR